jgi:hypothetical protein
LLGYSNRPLISNGIGNTFPLQNEYVRHIEGVVGGKTNSTRKTVETVVFSFGPCYGDKKKSARKAG